MAGILHVIEDLDYGGAQTQLTLLAEGATVASLRRPGPVGARLCDRGVRVSWLGRRFGIDPLVGRRLLRLLRGGDFRAVQSWDAASGRHVLLARRWWGATPRWLHTVRESRRADPLERRARRAADRLVTPSATIADNLLRDGARPETVCLVPNESGSPDAGSVSREEVLRRLGLPPATRLLVAATRLDRARLAKELVWAADLVRVVRPEVRLVLVGDGPARRRVERFARGAAEPGLAVFAGWRDDWSDLLSAAEVVWCASDSPDTPTPLVEAMRAGKPVVANEAPGRERLIVEGETGWLTRWNDRAGWARATARLLEDRGLAGRVGAAARDSSRKVYPLGVTQSSYARVATE